MKVILYIHSLYVGGAEQLVTDYAIILMKRGIDVTIIVNKKANTYLERRLYENDVRIIPLFRGIGNKFIDKLLYYCLTKSSFFNRRMTYILKKEKPDILHIHTNVEYITKESMPPKQMIYTFHSNLERYFNILGEDVKHKIKSLSNEGMNFIAISKNIEEKIRTVFMTDRIRYIPNGINIKTIEAISKKSNKKILHELGLNTEKFIIGNVGRFNKVKNHERLILIFETVKHIQANAILLLIGEDENGRMKKIKSLVREKGIEDSVFFLGLREDVLDIMASMDVIVIPSYSESFSLTAMEAQVLGIRCVASDNLPNEVFCNQNCIKLSLNDSNAEWAEAILSEKIVVRNKDINRFSLEAVIDETLEYYDEILRH